MIQFIASKKDPAGMNLAKELEKHGKSIHYITENIIFADNLPNADFYIFLSRHKSESKMPCLTSHCTGIFSSDTTHGGNAKELGICYPSYHACFLKNLYASKIDGFQIITEPTHHGPTHLTKPLLFIEIGSSENEWTNKKAAESICKALIKTIDEKPKHEKIAIAFGGTHYPEKFTKMITQGDYAIGHIMPKYAIEHLDEDIFKQMIERTVEKPKYCIIDWKGCNRKGEIIELAKKYGLEVVRT